MNQRIVIAASGGPEALSLTDEPVPVAGPGELLVRVEATGVAFADILMRRGLYPTTGFPVTPGYEVVGPVIGGEGVAPGTRVAALTVTGGYATHAVIAAASAVPVPGSLTSPQAAALVLNGLTAWQMLTRANALNSTRSMLVWGAAGGVGSILVELGRQFGIRTFGVASGQRLRGVEAAGAVPIDRAGGDVAAAVRAHEPGGVDVVFDGVGGGTTGVSLKALARGGQVVMYGVQGMLGDGSSPPSPPATELFFSATGLRGYMVTDWSRHHAKDLAALFALAAAGAITPRVHAELPLAEARRAHELMERGEIAGKIILCP